MKNFSHNTTNLSATANDFQPKLVAQLSDDYITEEKLHQLEEDQYCYSGLLLYRYNDAINEIEVLLGRDHEENKLSLLVMNTFYS